MRRLSFGVTFGCIVTATLLACGGSSGVDVASGGDDAGMDAPDRTADGGSGADSTGGGKDGTAGGDGGAIDSATPLPDGSVAADGGSDPDAQPGGNASQMPCGDATCAIPGQICCVYAVQLPPPDTTYACVVGTTCPQVAGTQGSVALQCTSGANCPSGTICCMQDNGGAISSSCQATCGNNGAQLCDPNSSSTGCPANQPCSSNNINDWGLPSSFATCGGLGH